MAAAKGYIEYENAGHRGDGAALGEEPRQQHDELVAAGARARPDRCPTPWRSAIADAQRVVPTAVVLVDVGQCARQRRRSRARRRRRRDVAVEADDRARIEADSLGDHLVRRGPLVAGERLGPFHRRAVALCAGMSSSSASASMVGASRSSPSFVTRWTVTVFMKASSPRPPVDFAHPPVGRT